MPAMRSLMRMRLSEALSRRLFVGELMLLALPSAAVLFAYGIFFAAGMPVVAVMAIAISAGRGLPGSWSEVLNGLQLAGLFAGFGAVAGLGVFALWRFVRIAHSFVRNGRASLLKLRGMFLSGALCAILPGVAWGYYVFLGASARRDPLLLPIVMSGLPLLIPVLHLALELWSVPEQARAVHGDAPDCAPGN